MASDDGGKVGGIPKESVGVSLWEESVNVKTCLGINTQSNRMAVKSGVQTQGNLWKCRLKETCLDL